MSDCPPCDIIILSYGLIPGLADTLKHRSLAIEEMYDKVAVSPEEHKEIVRQQKAIIKVLEEANESQLVILKKLNS